MSSAIAKPKSFNLSHQFPVDMNDKLTLEIDIDLFCFVLDVYLRHVSPGSQGHFDTIFNAVHNPGLELRGSQETSNQCMESLLSTSIHLKNRIFSEQFSDCFWVCGNERVPMVLHNHLVHIWICGHNDGSSQYMCLEHLPIPTGKLKIIGIT